MTIRTIFPVAVFLLSACSSEDALPNGYALDQSPMNREWLKGPDGMMVAPGLVKSLHRSGDRLVLVALAATSGNQPIPPTPIDNTCYIALSIDTDTRIITQVTVAKAHDMAKGMEEVISTNRNC